MSAITRKNYLELFALGGEEPISRHVDPNEAVEAAINQPPGEYEIRVGGGLYLSITVTGPAASPVEIPSVQMERVEIGGIPHVRLGGLTVVAGGGPQDIICKIVWDQESPIELYLGDNLIGRA